MDRSIVCHSLLAAAFDLLAAADFARGDLAAADLSLAEEAAEEAAAPAPAERPVVLSVSAPSLESSSSGFLSRKRTNRR